MWGIRLPILGGGAMIVVYGPNLVISGIIFEFAKFGPSVVACTQSPPLANYFQGGGSLMTTGE